MAGARIRVASGNFVTAQPIGVLNGVDYQHTGKVRRIDQAAIRQHLDDGAIALIPPLGYSPTGEVFNLTAADVATSTATVLGADKLVCLVEGPGLLDPSGRLTTNLTLREADQVLASGRELPEDLDQYLRAGVDACRSGIKRVHLVSRKNDGALLRELFTRDGIGTLLTAEAFEGLRQARIYDVGGILELLAPLEEQGVLVRRSRERLETEIDRFFVMERDGMVMACAALYLFPQDGMAELACVAVHPDYRDQGRGDKLLDHVTNLARTHGIPRLFVLTTQTAHWFRERGFNPGHLEDLPMEKKAMYNYRRGAKVFLKTIS
jgi:amino-acid N-acetyltransferase